MAGINKVIVDSTALVDIGGDTVTAADLLQGITAYDGAGDLLAGTACSVTPEYIRFTNSAGYFYVTNCNGVLIVNSQAKASTIGSKVLLGVPTEKIGALPASWNVSTAMGGSFCNYSEQYDGSGYEYQSVFVKNGSLFVVSGGVTAAMSAILTDGSTINNFDGVAASTWTWSNSADSYKVLSKTSTITVTKMGNIAFLYGDFKLQSGHSGAGWLPIAKIPESFSPPMGIGVNGYSGNLTSSDDSIKWEYGALLTSGELQLYAGRSATSGAHYVIAAYYPLDLGTEVT